MGSVAGEFFSKLSEEDKANSQSAMNSASSEEMKSTPISIPGNYLCEVATYAYRKEGEKMKVFPEMFISPEKKSLNLSVNFKVVDGTDHVRKGSTIFTNITLIPGSADGKAIPKEKFDTIMRFTKPKLATLTGVENINMTPEWFDEYLSPEFVEEGKNKFKLVRDHKMKNLVMVMVDEEMRDNKIKMVCKTFVKAKPGDKSEEFAIIKKDDQSTATFDSKMDGKTPPGPVTSFAGIADTGDVGIGVDNSDIPVVPEVEDFN